MATAKIVWTEEARSWLREIWEYIAKDNPTAANKTIDGIFDKAQLLTKHPEAGFKYELAGKDNVRVLLYGHYRIAYVLTDPDTVHILGVFHAALDIDRYFHDEGS